MQDRKKVEKELLAFLDLMAPGGPSVEIWKKQLEQMDDKQFDAWIETLDNGGHIAFYNPNNDKSPITMKTIYAFADKLEYPIFQRVWLTDPATGQRTLTANKHLIGIIPVRRQVQMLAKKRSIPGSAHVVNEMSGQAAGGSKGSRLSGPEIQVNVSKGLVSSIQELIKFRGGDGVAYTQMNRQILETGRCSLNSIMAETPSIVKSNKTLSVRLSAMMLKNNAV